MSDRLLNEKLISLADARELEIPKRNGKAVSPSTVTRWIHRGIRAGDGSLVRLEAIKVGRTLMTTRESIRRFFTALTERSTFVTSESKDTSDGKEQCERPVRELQRRNLL